jgi:RES domain-containing protein
MIVYRITTPKYAQLRASGRSARWNKNGDFVIYFAGNISLACLENVVHRDSEGLIGNFSLMRVQIPKKVSVKKIQIEDLPENWSDKFNYEICQEISINWLNNHESCVLCVPSVIVPLEYNYLINPQHADFRFIKLLSVEKFTFDNRLKNT